MEWLTTGGEIYHHACKAWTHSIESGKCEHCQAEIPAASLRIARDDAAERERVARQQDVRRSLKSLSERFTAISEKGKR
jgi:hypothetical protein